MSTYDFQDLAYLMQRLRNPETGCSWDIKQTFATIAPHTVEETYEVVDAIEREDWPHLEEELGDLLFQVIFYCQMGKEKDYFNLDTVIHTLVEKLVRRHPHVFPDGTLASQAKPSELNEEQVLANWEKIKQQEKAAKQVDGSSILDDVPASMPALIKAKKLQKKAASVGFDFANWKQIKAKVLEELEELEAEIENRDKPRQQQEMGDLLFSCVNLARWLKIDAERALSGSNLRFQQRFKQVEARVLEQGGWQNMSSQKLEQHWCDAKQAANDDVP